MDDPSVTRTWKDATFPLVHVGDSQPSRPASKACGLTSIWILTRASWLLFIPILRYRFNEIITTTCDPTVVTS